MPDSVAEAGQPDEVTFFPQLEASATRFPGFERRWTLPDLLNQGALDLGDVLEFERWLTPMRAGFIEGPQTHVFAGDGSPSLRLLIDGYDYVSIGSAGYLDTHLVSIAEFERIDLLRTPGGYTVDADLFRRRREDAYSRIAGGTGDFSTNLISGLLSAHLFGSPIAFGYDRVDSRGSPELGSSMERNSIWTKISRPLVAGVWGQLEYRRSVLDRDQFVGTDRRDIILRLRRSLSDGWWADLIAGNANVKETPAGAVDLPDSLVMQETFKANQLALRAGRESERWSARATLRVFDGDGVPSLLNELSARGTLGPLSVYGTGRHEKWSDFTVFSGYAAIDVQLPLGFHVTADGEDGGRGLIGGSPPVEREFITRASLGAGWGQGLWDLLVRGGRWRVNPSPGLGQPFDSAFALPGGTVSVVEAWGTVPLFRVLGGQLSASGYYQAREAGNFAYWPKDQWYVEGRYHNLFQAGQGEVILTARGGTRGSMLVPAPELGPGSAVPSEDLLWFRGEVVFRVKDVHIFWNYEGYEASDVPGDLPSFPFPRGRSHFGLRWEFWN